MSEEWGPWIEHDGMPAPHLMGRRGEVEAADGRIEVGVFRNTDRRDRKRSLFIWDTLRPDEYDQRVLRYRIRKPRGLTILQDLMATLDAPEGPVRSPVQPKVDA